MANQNNYITLTGLLGKKAGAKLFNWLDGCCDTFCEDVQACAGTGLPAILVGNGTVAAPSISFVSNPDTGLYFISSTQTGFSTGGALVGGFNATGLFTNIISEQTAAVGVTVDGLLIKDGGILMVKSNVTQLISKTTGVATTTNAGVITTFALTDAANASFTFTVTNALAVATSVIQLTVDQNGSTGFAVASVTPGVGSFNITVKNVDASAAFNAAIKIHYTIV